jgi:hypothetical protein
MQRITHHDFRHREFPDDALQCLQVRQFIFAAQGGQALRSDTQQVGNGHPNGPGADIQSEKPAF